jgi:hypothetical protein
MTADKYATKTRKAKLLRQKRSGSRTWQCNDARQDIRLVLPQSRCPAPVHSMIPQQLLALPVSITCCSTFPQTQMRSRREGCGVLQEHGVHREGLKPLLDFSHCLNIKWICCDKSYAARVRMCSTDTPTILGSTHQSLPNAV